MANEPLRSKKPKNPNNWHTKRQKGQKDAPPVEGSKDAWDPLPEQPKKQSLHPAAKRLERKQAKAAEAEADAEAAADSKEAQPQVVTLLCGGLPFEVDSEVRFCFLPRPPLCRHEPPCLIGCHRVQDIRKMFACHGTVLKANVAQNRKGLSRGFAFVEMEVVNVASC